MIHFTHAQIIGGAVVIVLALGQGIYLGIKDQIAISRRAKWWREGGWRFDPPANG